MRRTLACVIAVVLSALIVSPAAAEDFVPGPSRSFGDINAHVRETTVSVSAGYHSQWRNDAAYPVSQVQPEPGVFQPVVIGGLVATSEQDRQLSEAAWQRHLRKHGLGQEAGATDVRQLSQVVAARAVASLDLPATKFVMQPNPLKNEWNALPVGLPLWLHVQPVSPISASVEQDGIRIDLTARPVGYVFDMGDGNVRHCVGTTYRMPDLGASWESPTCGYRYREPGDYQIRARVEWLVSWSALGQSGQLRVSSAEDAYGLKVNELRSVIVGPR